MATGDGATFKGSDKLGKFTLRQAVCCGVCGKKVMTCVHYEQKPKVTEYVAKARSLLIRNKRTNKFIRTIGINCGCYAKVHRQLVHIAGGR